MDEGKVRTIHYHLGITYVWFLLLQILLGLLMSLGMLFGATNSGWYQVLYRSMPIGIHWGPFIASSWEWPSWSRPL